MKRKRITRRRGRYVKGVLVRDKDARGELCFWPKLTRDHVALTPEGRWDTAGAKEDPTSYRVWEAEEFADIYGKAALPAKGEALDVEIDLVRAELWE